MIVRAAVFTDVAELYAGLGIATPRAEEYRALVRQLALGPAWCFRPSPDAPIAALTGIVWGLEEGVIWFRSGAGAERVMPGLVRAFRAELAAAKPGQRIVTWEQATNPKGQRIARALGFVDTGRRIGALQIWELQHGRDGHRNDASERGRGAGGRGAQVDGAQHGGPGGSEAKG
jgi:hypothetical protein